MLLFKRAFTGKYGIKLYRRECCFSGKKTVIHGDEFRFPDVKKAIHSREAIKLINHLK